MLGDVVDEQHFGALGPDAESLVRVNSPFRRHERRVGENHVKVLAPAPFARERVVLMDLRRGKPCRYMFTSDSFTMSGEMS